MEFAVTCPGGHADCMANLQRNSPLYDYEQGKSIGQQLGV